ncbi:cobalamin-dependent protein [Hymenobacter sp. BT683]|uniref:Cobalamin-dependent protein n=1 Tax=Hymenobacter jeongseonensis TaxID=2791027 RepID=A0ABS0IHM9_9BACT|nr:cobalamin-dependent protein [Hymenobacter jeongseonensis]MBF9237873.1 cobalamin-dependent protein [Hymenobacter jeongseonensis]
MPTTDVLREHAAQRLYQELDALADYAVNQLGLPSSSTAAGTGTAPTNPEQLKQHLLALANAILMDSPALFEAHMSQVSEQAGAESALEQIAAIRKAVLLRLSVGQYALAATVLSAVTNSLSADPTPAVPGKESAARTDELSALASGYLKLLLAADRPAAQRLLLDEAENGVDVRDIYLDVLQPAQREVGNLWHSGTISVAQEHYCTAATASLMAQFQPYFQRTPRNGRHLLAACVAGDLHTLGLQMVADFLEYEGWNVSYLGASTPLESIRAMAAEQGVDLLLAAASMPHHVPLLRELVTSLRRDAATQHVRVLVGGRPFARDEALWESIGADGWASSAKEAVAVVQSLFNDDQSATQAKPIARAHVR